MTDEIFAITVPSYLVFGFVLGYLIVREGDCESPIETWAFATFAGPLLVAALVLVLIPFAPFYALVRLLGVESADVGNDRF